MKRRIRTLAVTVVGAAVLMVGPMAGTVAAHDIELEAGVACTFGLGIDIDEAGPGAVFREWRDADGNLVRTLSAGTGLALTFTNEETGATMSTPWNGSVIKTVYNADGTQNVTMTGHTVLIMSPTDVPAGPSTTLYIGRVAFTVDTHGTFEIQSTAGRQTDICAALAP